MAQLITEQLTIVLSIIAIILGVLAFIGVGIIMRNIKQDKPVKPITAEQEIDYHGADKLGGTCNDDD